MLNLGKTKIHQPKESTHGTNTCGESQFRADAAPISSGQRKHIKHMSKVFIENELFTHWVFNLFTKGRIPMSRSKDPKVKVNGRGPKVIEVKYPSVYPKYGKCCRTPIYYTIVVTSIKRPQAPDTLSLALFQEYDEGKYSLRWKPVTTECGPVMLLLPRVCFKIK